MNSPSPRPARGRPAVREHGHRHPPGVCAARLRGVLGGGVGSLAIIFSFVASLAVDRRGDPELLEPDAVRVPGWRAISAGRSAFWFAVLWIAPVSVLMVVTIVHRPSRSRAAADRRALDPLPRGARVVEPDYGGRRCRWRDGVMQARARLYAFATACAALAPSGCGAPTRRSAGRHGSALQLRVVLIPAAPQPLQGHPGLRRWRPSGMVDHHHHRVALALGRAGSPPSRVRR